MADPVGSRVGKIIKPYGLEGKLVTVLEAGSRKYIKKGNPLFIDIEGQRVPFFVESVEELDEKRSVLELEFIRSVDEARRMAGCHLHLDETQKTGSAPDRFDPVTWIGYQVVDKKLGKLGAVKDYLDSEMNPVIILDFGGREIMVPATEAMITRVSDKKGVLYTDLPEGLTEL